MTEQRPDELTLPTNEPTAEPPRPEPIPSPLDMDTFQRLLAQHDRESEHTLQRALADLERTRRESSRTPYRDSLSPLTWGDLERFRHELNFRLALMAEIGGIALLFIVVVLGFHAALAR